MDEDRFWREFRRRARRRANAWMMLIVGPVILVGAVFIALRPHDYPAGDYRNDPGFWAAFALAFFLLVGIAMIGSIRVLRER